MTCSWCFAAMTRGTPPASSSISELWLLRVVTNLVENAAKYSPTTKPVTILVTSDGSLATLVIEDWGAGIPVAERERVFERFYRGDPARARDTGGAGLGLAIVLSIVEAHGGAVSLEERSEGGTRAVVQLPSAPPYGSPPRGSSGLPGRGRSERMRSLDGRGGPPSPAGASSADEDAGSGVAQ